MQSQLRSAAWALGLWGAFSVIFGVMILIWPDITVKVFLVLLGVYLIATGIVLFIGSLINREGHWIVGTLIGVLSFLAGLYVFAHPQTTALAVLTLIALWSIAVGVLEIVGGFETKKNNWLLVVAGLIYALFGLYIFANPKNGAIALIWLIGLSVIAHGAVLVVAAFEANKESRLLAKGA